MEILLYFGRILQWEIGLKSIINNIYLEGQQDTLKLLEKFLKVLRENYTKDGLKSIFTIESDFNKLNN